MQIITGNICRLMHSSTGEVNGFVLDHGLDVHFSPDKSSRVLAIITPGSRVEVQVRLHGSVADVPHIEAISITDLDSKRSASLDTPTASPNPEVPFVASAPPTDTVPLVPSKTSPEELYSRHAASQPLVTRSDVTDEIEQAYDALYRTQVMLAYFRTMNQQRPTIGRYLDEAKHTYAQALSRYQARDFEEAREFSRASSHLSRAVEILISRTFRANTDYLKRMPPPPEHASSIGRSTRVQKDLDRVERVLSRIHWLTENGTPSEDRAQVEKLSSWSENLCGRARCLLQTGAMDDAIELARAADAAASSAEHVSRKCYVTRDKDAHFAARAQ